MVASASWIMPNWMEPYRQFLQGAEGQTVEELMRVGVSSPDTGAEQSQIRAGGLRAQVVLLERLHAAHRLRRVFTMGR